MIRRYFYPALYSTGRQWVKCYWLLCLLFLAPVHAQEFQADWSSLDHRPTPTWFTDAKFGIFIHWGTYSVPAYAPVIPGKLAYAEWYWNALSNGRDNPSANPIQTGTWEFHKNVFGATFDYQNFAPQFRAELFDPKQWAAVLVRSGAKYVVLTSKHHEGFALWPSKEASSTWGRPWNAVDTGPKQDVLGELTQAVRERGLRMGFYYSLYEWYNPLWLTDKRRYVQDHMIPQFKDLVNRYQPSIIFSDGEWELPSAAWRTPELLAWLFNDSPVKNEVVINDRWGSDSRHKHGGYWTTEYTSGMSGMSHPWEESRGIGFSYGYNRAERLADYHTGPELVTMLVDIVSRGGNLLLDIGPRADGTIPVIMEDRLTQIGAWLSVNGEAIYGTRPWRTNAQWSAGELPKTEYNKEFESAYDVQRLTQKPAAGKAAIDAFFTVKGTNLFAILPRWPEHHILLKGVTGARSVSLLGSASRIRFRNIPAGVLIDVPELPGELLQQPAWVLKVGQ